METSGKPSEKKRGSEDLHKIRYAKYGVAVACVLFLLAELFIERHALHPWESLFGFYGFFGFFSCVVLMIGGKILHRLLGRKEEYYDD